MEQKESIFNEYVCKQAKDLLDEIKSNSSTYGKVKEELQRCEKTVKWSGSQSHYLAVIAEAKLQLDKEIDVITLR